MIVSASSCLYLLPSSWLLDGGYLYALDWSIHPQETLLDISLVVRKRESRARSHSNRLHWYITEGAVWCSRHMDALLLSVVCGYLS